MRMLRLAVPSLVALWALASVGPHALTRTDQPQAAPVVDATSLDARLRAVEPMLRREGDSAEAEGELTRLLAAARELGLEAPEAQALCGLAELHLAQARYAEAAQHVTQAAAIYQRLSAAPDVVARRAVDRGVGRTEHILSVLATLDGRADEAQRHAERAVAAFDLAEDRRGRALATLQLLHTSPRAAARDAQLYDRVIADAREAADPLIEAAAFHSLGDAHFTAGRFAAALEALQAAQDRYAAEGQRGHLGTVYNSLGRVYRAHGRLDAALASQLEALALHEQENSSFALLQSLNAVAVTHQGLGNWHESRLYFDRALRLAEEGSTPRIQDFLRANLATTLIEGGDYRAAADILEGVVARRIDAYPEVRMRELASAYLLMGRPADALGWADKAVAACGDPDTVSCVLALDRRSAVHAARGDRDAALADLQQALASIERVRARLVPADFLKQQFHVAHEHLYSRSIALQLGRQLPRASLETAERARARAFADLLASRDLAPPAAAPPDAAVVDAIREGVTSDLASTASIAAASSADLAATAARLGSTIVSYWVTRTEVFIWVTTPDGRVRATQVPLRHARLVELIRATTPHAPKAPVPRPGTVAAAITTRGEDTIVAAAAAPQAWRELYDVLVKPVRAWLPRTPGALLTIVPHGPLGAISFAALQDSRGRYLLEDFAIHYAPSGAALQFTAAQRRRGARAGRMLLVADPVPPVRSALDRPLPRLPGARVESRAVAALIPRARLSRFEEQAAREREVRAAAPGKAVLHFATHAIVRDDEPLTSFLALTPAEDGADDGLLTAQEIYQLRLDADLVVLSACRSAGGRVTGDGLATFARAFMYAGAPSIVASVWDVADGPTNQLVTAFYREWLGGASKARALRTAQLALLAALRAGRVQIPTAAGSVAVPEHPVFWAGFALFGEPH